MEFFAAFYSRENVQVKIYCLDNILANNESAADTFYSLQTPSWEHATLKSSFRLHFSVQKRHDNFFDKIQALIWRQLFKT